MRVPATSHRCFPSDEVEVVLSTTEETTSRIMFPGQVTEITLAAVEPAWPQVTDASDTGYFYRTRERTRRNDWLKTSTNRENGISETITEPVVEFEFQPKVSLAVSLLDVYQGETGDPLDVVTPCASNTFTAVDKDLAKNDGYEPMVLEDADEMPSYAIKKASQVTAEVQVSQQVANPGTDNEPKECTWVQLDDLTNPDTPVPLTPKVSHTNNLGFSLEDMAALELDPASAEYKEFSRAVSKTMNLPMEELQGMSTCSVAGEGSATCLNTVTYTNRVAYTDAFEADGRCLSFNPDKMIDAVSSGYGPITDVSKCTEQWAERAAAEQSVYRAWHTIEFDALTAIEEGMWGLLELTEAYREHEKRDTPLVGGLDFDAHVLVASSKPWGELSTAQKEAATQLRFTPDTWGRSWALLERIFHDDTSLIAFDSLTAAEQRAVTLLGYGQESWDGTAETIATTTTMPTAKVNASRCTLRPPARSTTPPPEEISILGVIYGVLLWADMNAATPPGSRGRSALCAGDDHAR